jgi:uncharacterized SAM-binding protein YcdF (DUF218 family)
METWTYEWAIRNLLAQLLMPPGIWLWLILPPLFLLKKRELLQKSLIVVGVVMIWLSSTNYLAVQLTNGLGSVITWSAPLDFKVLENKQKGTTNSSKPGVEQAIVILGGGRRSGAIEYPQYQDQNIEARAMERVRYGVTLSQVTHLPILLTGGAPDVTSINELTEAGLTLTQKILKNEFLAQARWVEKQSRTTEENAAFSAKILKQEGVTHIYLVTHFWYMPRAQAVFEKYGLKVTPAHMGFTKKISFIHWTFTPAVLG